MIENCVFFLYLQSHFQFCAVSQYLLKIYFIFKQPNATVGQIISTCIFNMEKFHVFTKKYNEISNTKKKTENKNVKTRWEIV